MTSIIKVNNLQNQCGANTINKCGTAITVGASGDTVTLAAGASQSGFGQTYSAVSWDTTPKTGLFTAVSGVGYFVNTTAGAITANLPAGSAGAIVSFADYTRTFATNNLTITPNGSEKIGGVAANFTASTEGQSITLVYVDATEGWINTAESTGQAGLAPAFITATGGTITTVDTDYKVHTFTGPGTFTVTCTGNPLGSSAVDYLVAAGAGGGGQGFFGGGGGAGGFRFYANTTCNPQPGSNPGQPLNNFPSGTAATISATSFPITVGAGGAGAPGGGSPGQPNGLNGNPSTFSNITSTAGGGGDSRYSGTNPGNPGGSGGGGGACAPGAVGGTGNTPPTNPSQGNNGGNYYGGGGGGAIAAGGSRPSTPYGGDGGNGAGVTGFGTGNGQCSSSVQYFSGGGGGGANPGGSSPNQPTGGLGGGGQGQGGCGGRADGTSNTGGGGGGGGVDYASGGAGGSGIVIIRYKFQ
jgi:hypothetical protein